MENADPGVHAAAGGVHSDLAAAHARFARAAMAIYIGTAAVAVSLLGGTLATDLSHEEGSLRETLSLETQVRAEYLSRHLHLLAEELTRLGLRSEVDLLDANMEPERSLLRLTHEKSAFFNVGVTILDAGGSVLWSEPQTFLATGTSLATQPLFKALRHTKNSQVVPAPPEGPPASVLYVAAPILRGGVFTGALLGAIDLASGRTLEPEGGKHGPARIVLAGPDGATIYPPQPAAFAGVANWRGVFDGSGLAFVRDTLLAGHERVVAGAPVAGTNFVLLSLAEAGELYGPARRRLAARLTLGLALGSLPLLLLVSLLRGSLRSFRSAEEDAVREQRLRSLGEAADLIAHEVKNSLNGIRVGLDLILRGERIESGSRAARAVAGMRTEIERLTSFTSELLDFSKGVVPRPVSLELGGFVGKVSDLSREEFERRGIGLRVEPGADAVRVRADPALVHVVLANLLGNALEFAGAGSAAEPRVTVSVQAADGQARVRVDDTGPGVAAAIRSRLFEPFVTGRPNGVGIGLALSRKIARAHGGDLTLEAGSGAAFRLTLPLEGR